MGRPGAREDYVIREKVTPDGYETHDDVEVYLPLGANGLPPEVTEEITNVVAPGRINIHKTGHGGVDLEGAVFTLYIDNPTVGEFDEQDGHRHAADMRDRRGRRLLLRQPRTGQLHRRRDDDATRVRHRRSGGDDDRHRSGAAERRSGRG